MVIVNKVILNIIYILYFVIFELFRNDRMLYKYLVSKYLYSYKFYFKFKYIIVLKFLIVWNDFKCIWCKNVKVIN